MNNYTVDVDNQSANNYSYDQIGNLTADNQAGVYNITWNVYGKLIKMNRFASAGEAGEIHYRNDPSGNRVGKTFYINSGTAKHYWYVRDAQGNVMAVYEMKNNSNWSLGKLKLIEHHMYGSSRLGIIGRDQDMDSAKVRPVNQNLIGNTWLYQQQRGEKVYELSNHLRNVLVTISDKKIAMPCVDDGNPVNACPVAMGGGPSFGHFIADVVNANDYYPFGMLMPGRKYSASDLYRYGFNGKEKDDEVKGEGAQYDYGFRIYDPRLGKFLSVDPITKNYPMLTPYQFASNSPISEIDQDGLEYIHFVIYLNKDGTFLKKFVVEDFRYRSEEEMNKLHNTTDFYKKYSAGYGPEGRGVKYTYFKENKDGKYELVKTDQRWEVTQSGFDEITRHGFYYGTGSITVKGPLFVSEQGTGKGYYEFGYKPVDMTDAVGREHDMEEDVPSFKGWQHPQNILADIRFVKRLTKFLELAEDDDYVDPFTGRKPSEEALTAARNAKTLFTAEIERKKLALLLMVVNKKISMKVYNYLELKIEQVEKEEVSLPTPKTSDK